MKTKPVIINALRDADWMQKAKDVLAKLRPIRLTADEKQIVEFLNYKRSVSGKWQTEGTLSIEPPIEI
jgi:hypothetical protein